VFTRPLRYPPNYPAEKPTEKGIDVQLAIDFVVSALDGRFDVGVVFSADTDLKPAIETVCARTTLSVQVATWQPAVGYASRIAIPNRKIWCHYLDQADFAAVEDRTNYA
jgi:NYN domain